MGKALKSAGLLGAAVAGWLLLAPGQPAGNHGYQVIGVPQAAAIDMDLRRPMFTQPSGRRTQQRPPPPRRNQAPAPAPQQRGFFDALFGAPQRPQYQPGYRPQAPAVARPPRQAPRRTAPRPAAPAVPARPAVEQTEFVYLLAPQITAKVAGQAAGQGVTGQGGAAQEVTGQGVTGQGVTGKEAANDSAKAAATPGFGADFGQVLGEALEAAAADRPVVGVRALTSAPAEQLDVARLLEPLPATLAAPDKSAVVVVAATPEWATLTEAQIVAVVSGVSAGLAARRAPVIWVGLPPVADKELSSRYAALNSVLRAAAGKAGGGFVDAWAVFADDSGGYAAYGPSVTGETVRLRGDDGVSLTKAGARKLAHFILVETRRLQARGAAAATAGPDPFALPGPQLPAGEQPVKGPPAPVARPETGPVLPLNVVRKEPDAKLAPLDGARQDLADIIVRRVLREGAPPPPQAGRADDFRWPRPGG